MPIEIQQYSGIFHNCTGIEVLLAASFRVIIIFSQEYGSKCVELGLVHLGLFIARSFMDYWRSLRNYMLNSFQKLLRKQHFVISLTLGQSINMRQLYLTFGHYLAKCYIYCMEEESKC